MRILQRYLAVQLLWTTLIALSVVLALFSFFSLIDQLEETGRGNYGVLQAVTYVILTMPRLAYELFPIAAMVGAMAALGIMAQHRELVIIGTSGVSRMVLAFTMLKAGMWLVIIAVVIGELVAPISEERAQHLRSVAQAEQITLKTRYGFWARDGNSYINIRKVLPGNRVERIYIFEFDDNDRLRSSTYAQQAVYEGERWRLEKIRQTIIEGDEVSKRWLAEAAWESLLDPEMINLVIVQPQYLTIWGLSRYIVYLRQNAQSSQGYEQALWIKLVRPISIMAMIVLAVPLVHGNTREAAVGQRVFQGMLIGVIFHIANEAAGHLGVVMNLPPPLSAGLPTLVLIGIIAWLLRR